jgi:hypothetical protein
MYKFWVDIAPYVAGLFSAGGAVSLIFARKERRAAQDIASGNAVDIMQKVYAQFIKDTAVEIGQLKEEVKMLRAVVESYKQTCDNCPNKNNRS